MEFLIVNFRVTLFNDKDIVMDEKWFAEANRLMTKFNLVPSVSSGFMILPSVDGNAPSIQNSYFMEFKKLDNSFKVSLKPNRFDIEKRLSSPSIASPINEFLNEAIEIVGNISSLQNSFSRVALAVGIDIAVSDSERGEIVKKFLPLSEISDRGPSDLLKRVVLKNEYKSVKGESLASMNEVIEFSSTDISKKNVPIHFGFDFNSTENNCVEAISRNFESILHIAASNIVKFSEISVLPKLI